MKFTGSYYDEFMIPVSPGNMRLSPDGTKLTVTVTGYQESGSLGEELYIYDRVSGIFEPLSLPEEALYHEFFDDSSFLLSCSKHLGGAAAGTSAVRYTLNGESEEIFAVPQGNAVISKLDDNIYMILARTDTPHNKDDGPVRVITELPYRYDGAGYITSGRTQIWIYSTDTSDLTALCTDDLTVRSHCWDPCSETLYFAGESYSTKPEYIDTVFEWSPCGGVRQICTLDHQCDQLGIHQGALTAIASDLYGNSYLYRIDKDAGSFTVLKSFEGDIGCMIDTDIGLGGGECISITEDSILMVYTDTSGVRIWEYRDGDFRPLSAPSLFVQSFVPTPDNALLAAGISNYRELEIYEWRNGGWKCVSDFNRKLCSLDIALPEDIDWTDTDGTKCTGWVVPPRNHVPGSHYPGILLIHEGPRGIYSRVWHSDVQLLSAHGYYVFYANMHGSAGVSREYADISGRMGTIDYQDLMLFTDAVLEQYPEIDRNRLAVCGTSYGGYMTNWIIGHTDRFCTAISMSSISNWIDLYGSTDMSFCVEYGSVPRKPWTNFEAYWRSSPLCYAADVRTPALFMHGDEDYRCPLTQALQMYNALQDYNIKTKLVIFRGCSHHFGYTGDVEVRLRRFKEMTMWLDETNKRK